MFSAPLEASFWRGDSLSFERRAPLGLHAVSRPKNSVHSRLRAICFSIKKRTSSLGTEGLGYGKVRSRKHQCESYSENMIRGNSNFKIIITNQSV